MPEARIRGPSRPRFELPSFDGLYGAVATLVAVVAFLAAWGYAVATYGLFLGLGLGWIPAIVIGVVVGALWPLLVVLVVLLLARANG